MQRITRATSVAFLPSVRLYIPAGKVSAALSPDKNPFDLGSLAGVCGNANSRFFTDCYHRPAAIGPRHGRKPPGPGLAWRRAAAAERAATAACRAARVWPGGPENRSADQSVRIPPGG